MGGLNFGWPWFEGSQTPLTCGGSPPASVPPIAQTDHVGLASLALLTFGVYRTGSGSLDFGPDYDGEVFTLEYYSGDVRRWHYDGIGWVAAAPIVGQPAADLWATGLNFVGDAVQGPDGAIYFAKMVPGEIRRLKPNTGGLTLQRWSGDNQAGNAGIPLPGPPVVRLTDAQGLPVVGAPITFAEASANGTLGPQPVQTDANGLAATTYTLGLSSIAGNPVITAQAPGGASTAFTAVWRGLVVLTGPLGGCTGMYFGLHHSETSSAFSIIGEIGSPAPIPTPYGSIVTGVLLPQITTVRLFDGLGLMGPPHAGIQTPPDVPDWSTSFSLCPPLGGLPIVFQAYAVDWARYPAPDAYLISNPVGVVIP